MRRFYAPPTQIKGPFLYLTGSEAHHFLHVLRLQVGAEIEVFDGEGKSYVTRVVRCTPEAICCHIVSVQTELPDRTIRFVLGQSIPKGEKMTWIIEKATELGIDALIPLQTERTVPRGDPNRLARWQERWQRKAWEAAKQCQRLHIPVVYPCMSWEAFLRQVSLGHPPELSSSPDNLWADNQRLLVTPGTVKLICWERSALPLRAGLPTQRPDQSILFVVGPEGGFTDQEIQQAQAHDFLPVSLGKRVLRTETVALAVLTLLQYLYGDFG